MTGTCEHPKTELRGTLSLSGPHQPVLKNPLKVTILRSPGVKFPPNLAWTKMVLPHISQMFKKARGRGKFFRWTYQELPIIRKCKEGRQAAWLPPSLLQEESRKSEIDRPIAVWGIQSQLQCVEHIHVFFFLTHLFVLFAWAQTAFNSVPEKKATSPVTTCRKAPVFVW